MLRVLLVDDSPPLRRRVAAMLEEIPGVGIVGEAESPGDALQLITEREPDVVILDLRLRDGVGMDVLQQIRILGHQPHVIVFTNHPMGVFREVYLAAGASEFLDKSRDFDRLIQLIEDLAPTA
jgi:two-component system response regulator DevR